MKEHKIYFMAFDCSDGSRSAIHFRDEKLATWHNNTMLLGRYEIECITLFFNCDTFTSPDVLSIDDYFIEYVIDMDRDVVNFFIDTFLPEYNSENLLRNRFLSEETISIIKSFDSK